MARRPRSASPSTRIPWKSLKPIAARELARELRLEKDAHRAGWRDKAALRRCEEEDLIARGIVTRTVLRSAAASRKELAAARLAAVLKAAKALKAHRARRHGKARMRDLFLDTIQPSLLPAFRRPMSFRLGPADNAMIVEDWEGSGDGVVLRNPPASVFRSASLGDGMALSVTASAARGVAWYTALGHFDYAFVPPLPGTLGATVSCANLGSLVMSASPEHCDPWPWCVSGRTQLWAKGSVAVYRLPLGSRSPMLVGSSPSTSIFTLTLDGGAGTNFLSTVVSSAPRLFSRIAGFHVDGGELVVFAVRLQLHTWAADSAAASVNFSGVGAGVGVSNVDVTFVP